MELITPTGWTDYELIDSGNREKLERFGRYVLSRPEPQALWSPQLSEKEWDRLTDARFIRASGKDADRGEWILKKGMPEQWNISYCCNGHNLVFRLGLTAFKHIGVFPEQASNWDWIYNSVLNHPKESPRVLNLFAYTGGASLAAKAAGGDVTHVDSVRQVINWGNDNMSRSGLKDIRWVVEDAMKFVRREVRRGNHYDGIILDPPAYGRGPDGEKWILEDNIFELLSLCKELFFEKNIFLVLNLYSMGLSTLIAENLFTDCIGAHDFESGELFVPDRGGRRLPLGLFLRSNF